MGEGENVALSSFSYRLPVDKWKHEPFNGVNASEILRGRPPISTTQRCPVVIGAGLPRAAIAAFIPLAGKAELRRRTAMALVCVAATFVGEPSMETWVQLTMRR
jgi:hypothetical protein